MQRHTGWAIVVVLVEVVLIVGVDVLFLRHHFVPRLIVNVAIVAAAGAVFLWLHQRAD